MMQHGARDTTVSKWTDLPMNPHLSLVPTKRAHPEETSSGAQPPRQVRYFFRTPLPANHAATLGSLFDLFETLPNTTLGTSGQRVRTVDPGEKLCHACEMYVAMVESPLIRFDHAGLLATALADGREIFLRHCS